MTREEEIKNFCRAVRSCIIYRIKVVQLKEGRRNESELVSDLMMENDGSHTVHLDFSREELNQFVENIKASIKR